MPGVRPGLELGCARCEARVRSWDVPGVRPGLELGTVGTGTEVAVVAMDLGDQTEAS